MNILEVKKIVLSRFRAIYLLYFVFVIVSLITRIVLLVMSLNEVDLQLHKIIWLFSAGLFMDSVAFSYMMIPLIIIAIFSPNRIQNSKILNFVKNVFLFTTLYLIIFNGIAEFFFWQEFGVRYNFIAVDYLLYTTEVLKNINESYPVPVLLFIVFLANIVVFTLLKSRKISAYQSQPAITFLNRLYAGSPLLILPLLSFYLITNSTVEKTTNNYNNELAKNGIYCLFSAFRNNELDYEKFYSMRADESIFNKLHTLLQSKNSRYLSKESHNISREIKNLGTEKKYNIILITVESLSGDFLNYRGSRLGKITPQLDALTENSLFFSNFYAVGTRTVYGLEAVTLGTPPKPGQSIVKRPNNENLFSAGQIFKERGYDVKYIYGGYGYFDNMNYFFAHNGYEIIDRSNLNKEEITFTNAWGVCDQDIFNRAIKECDKSYSNEKPFFFHVMTTSNHRPYTYPEGFIDIPSHSGRLGAVKYCDYAIGELIEKARQKPWFKNTLFVILADHCAGSAGQVGLPFQNYHIPLFIYNPFIVPPREIKALCSQIDVMPTIFGLMNLSYKTKFFGKDILKMTSNEERAFISNYQNLGLMKGNMLTILHPQRRMSNYLVNYDTEWMEPTISNASLEEEAITYYQSANYLYKNHLDEWEH